MKTKLIISGLFSMLFFAGFMACKKDKNNDYENINLSQLMGKKFHITKPPILYFENDEDRTFTNGKVITLTRFLSFEQDKVPLLNIQGAGYVKLAQTSAYEISTFSNNVAAVLEGILIKTKDGGIRLKEIPATGSLTENLYRKKGQSINVGGSNYTLKGNVFITFKEVE